MAEVEPIAENDFDPDPDDIKRIIKSDPDLDARFREIVGEYEIIDVNHVYDERWRVTPNGDLTIFYRYFFSKYITIRQGIDARSGMMDKHASIFPFQARPDLPVRRVAVAALFDDKFANEIREFVGYHFGDDFDFEHLKDLFLTNIDDFKRQHFQRSPTLRQLTHVVGLGSSPWRRDTAPEYLSDYFADCIRLNGDGARWYQHFQTKFNELCNLYQRESLKVPEKSELYFQYLPEINCCELLLLLETDFYESSQSRRRYVEIFKKYLFFFGHAISSADPHPVCFVDEALFKCLQFKKRFETFRGDILKLEWELWMMTLVHRRKHQIPMRPIEYSKPGERNLRSVIEYADRIPRESLESAVVYYGEPQYRRFKIFFVYDDVAFLIGHSRRTVRDEFTYGQILKSALMNREIRTITYYNVYYGVESSFEMPANTAGIRDLIRELTQLHRPGPLYPEKFLVHQLEDYFERLPPVARD